MPTCNKCQTFFKPRAVINGCEKVFNKRKYCFACSPYGAHNTVKLHEKERSVGQEMICSRCRKPYIYVREAGMTTKFCAACSSTTRKIRTKLSAIALLGGKCWVCGYDRCANAMDFHHIAKSTKRFNISANTNRSWASIECEVRKCALLCCRCHREVEAGVTELPRLHNGSA